MNSYLEASITYDMTEPVIVDRSLIGTWITVDQDMEVVFQTDLIKVWLEEFGNKMIRLELPVHLQHPMDELLRFQGEPMDGQSMKKRNLQICRMILK